MDKVMKVVDWIGEGNKIVIRRARKTFSFGDRLIHKGEVFKVGEQTVEALDKQGLTEIPPSPPSKEASLASVEHHERTVAKAAELRDRARELGIPSWKHERTEEATVAAYGHGPEAQLNADNKALLDLARRRIAAGVSHGALERAMAEPAA